MKNFQTFIKLFFVAIAFIFTGCVHDDEYANPDVRNYKCQDLTATKTLAEVKALYATNTNAITDDIIIEGYVSSSDETGNIYKTIYLQDAPENPTQGLIVSVDAVSTYTQFPQGSKVYIKLKDLAFGRYGNALQVGYINDGVFGRIPEKLVANHIVKSCQPKATIVPKVLTLSQLSSNDALIGALIQVNGAEFTKRLLCNTYAPAGTSVDRQLTDATSTVSSRVVRNSGFASFANQTLPTGNGTFVGVLSKFNSTYQFYINRVSDLNMNGARLDGSTPTCAFSSTDKTQKTVAQVKSYFTGALTQITEDTYLKAQVTANDKTGNLFKYIYVEDATGGLRINIDMNSMYGDPRFYVGKELIVNLKGLYIGNVNGELQLGGLFGTSVGRILADDVYKHLFPSDKFTEVIPTERRISELTNDDVGRWIKIKDLEFIDADLGSQYAPSSVTNRTLKDCAENTIILRTSNFASFAKDEIDGGKGDVYAILSIFNDTYQLWITNRLGADLDNPRCDGSVPPVTLYSEDFASGLTNWTAENVAGTQVWATTTFGNPGPSVLMNGFAGGSSNVNEDWLISKPIALNGYTSYSLSFETDGRFTGNPLEVYVTDNYTGVSTTSWTKLNPTLDTDLTKFSPFVNSGNLDVSAFAGKNLVIAFKYTSTATNSTTWELDNVKVKGKK